MNKMITIALAALSLNSALACEPYFALSSGPLVHIPGISIGARLDDTVGKVDVSLSYAYDEIVQIARLSMSKLIFGPGGVYVGPSYALSFHDIKCVGKGNDCLLGVVLGKDFSDSFIETTVYKCVLRKGLKFDETQVLFRIGVKF